MCKFDFVIPDRNGMQHFLPGVMTGVYGFSAYLFMRRLAEVWEDERRTSFLKRLGDEEGRWVYDTFVTKTQTKQSMYVKGQYPEQTPQDSGALR